jgi:hypothetical protein
MDYSRLPKPNHEEVMIWRMKPMNNAVREYKALIVKILEKTGSPMSVAEIYAEMPRRDVLMVTEKRKITDTLAMSGFIKVKKGVYSLSP